MYDITQAAGATSGLKYIMSMGVAQSFKPCLLDAVECLFIQKLAISKFPNNILDPRWQIGDVLYGEATGMQLHSLVEILEVPFSRWSYACTISEVFEEAVHLLDGESAF